MKHCFLGFFFIVCCFLSRAELSAAEQYPLKRIEVEDGLSQNMVYSICQDNNDFMWFGTQGGLNRYDGYSFKVFGRRDNLRSDNIMTTHISPDGELWVGTISGLYVYDKNLETFSTLDLTGKIRDICFSPNGCAYAIVDAKTIVKVEKNFCTNVLVSFKDDEAIDIRDICFDTEGRLWAVGYSLGLMRIDKDGTKQSYHFSCDGKDHFTKISVSDSENFLLGTIDKGVLRFNLRTAQFSHCEGLGESEVIFAHDILSDSKGRIWVGAENGLFIKENGRVTHLTHIPNDPYSLSDNAVFSLFEDNEGGIWIGTYFGGINYYSEYQAQFKKYYPCPGYNGLKGKNISEFLEDGDGTIWVGTEDSGLHLFNPNDGHFESGFIPSSNVHALADIGGQLWVGTYGDGLYIIDRKKRSFQNYRFSGMGYSQIDDNIYCILKGLDGQVLLGTDGGLFVLDSRNMNLKVVAQNLIKSTVIDICQDFYGNIWVATSENGLFCRNSQNNKWERIECGYRYMTCIMEDTSHNLWFGTGGSGLLHYEHNSGTFDFTYSSPDALPDKTVYKLVEDASGNIWGSTNHGLFCLSAEDGRVIIFDHKSGLVCDQYNFRAGLRASDGQLYFGGVKGFVGFSPDAILLPKGNSRLVFNRLFIYNDDVNPGVSTSPLEKSIINCERIVLKPSQSSFGVSFADLDYPFSGARNYQYRLTGFADRWYEADRTHIITFSHLKRGKYTLELKTNSYSDSSEVVSCMMKIQVLSPWYLTWWALAIYIVVFISACWSVALLSIKAVQRKNADILEKMNLKKERELYDAKISFFTNITHEIRTPLTLITAPAEDLVERTPKNSPLYEDLSVISKNANRLLTLVNELLDFRKVESGKLLPNFSRHDIVMLTKDCLQRFLSRIDNNNIKLDLHLPQSLYVDVDNEIFTKILSNVLSNACKHATSRIELHIVTMPDSFRLAISNDGDKIPEEEAEHIFDPFVKLDDNVSGSGIGLAFARNLAGTHGGSLKLDTSSNDTCFVLELPLVQANAINYKDIGLEEEISGTVDDDGRRKILVVDDNDEMRSFLSRKLGGSYRVFAAKNGLEASAIMSREVVDLVITDLMMPVMDGVSLCSAIKGDIRTCHIPVVLITAKSDMGTRIECMRKGADDYITKPFQIDYLRVRIENLLTARINLKKAFSSSPDLSVSSIATSKKDEEFIEKLKSIIESRIEETALDVDDLAQAMNMSRATFYRKMKGFSDVSPNEFIRLYRLKKAAKMLVDGKTYINEIAYAVGFSSNSYFSRCFRKQFGLSPKEYAANSGIEHTIL